MLKTRAAILYKLGSPLVVEDIEVPQPKKGQVLVKILYSGICRAQLNEIAGLKGPDKHLPHLLGHEASGIVKRVGTGVRKVKPGDFVVLTWIKGKGLEVSSTQYRSGKKVINAGAVTTFSNYSVVSENRVVKIKQIIPPEKAALLGCSIPTGAGIVLNTLKVARDSTIAIFGVGGIGLSVVIGARMRKCRKIIAVDIDNKALRFARNIGATDTVLFKKETILSKIKRLTNDGVDYAVEASGNKAAMEAAFAVVNDAGTAVIAGNLQRDKRISIQPFDLIRGKKIIGTWGGETNPDRDIPFYAKAYKSGALKLDSLISKKIRLDEINMAMKMLQQNKHVGRMVIDFT